MKKKPLTIKNITKLKRQSSNQLPDDIADKWVNDSGVLPQKINNNTVYQEPEIRFTVVIPTYLHKRIKKYCATNTISMKKKLIQIFQDNFPES